MFFFQQTELEENVPIGSFVITVQASDPDEGDNGLVHYSLPADVSETLLTINEETGQIYTKSEIDREETPEIVFGVIATDSGKPAMSSTTSVTIVVKDVNDNSPVLMTHELRVRENLKPESAVGTLKAGDLDSGRNAEVVFRKQDGDNSDAPFTVKSKGKVISLVSLDREVRDSYTIDLVMLDKGEPRRTSTAQVTIIVDDVNDMPPVVTSSCLGDEELVDSRLNSTFEDILNVPGFIDIDWHRADSDRVITQVKAVDEDTGVNADLTFALPFESENPLFTVDEKSGHVYLARHLTVNDDLQHLVNVSVSDSGKPKFTTFCALNVTFDIDVNELTLPTSTEKLAPPSVYSVRPELIGDIEAENSASTKMLNTLFVVCLSVIFCILRQFNL